MKRNILLTIVLLALTAMTASADIPRYIDYQGRLMDAAGAAVADGNCIVIIKLYDSTQTSVLWTKTYNPVATKNGYFSITLGDTTPQWTGLNFNQQYYIGTQINTDAEMTPRQAWSAAPYAMNVANGAITTSKLASNAVDGSKILDNTITDHDIANKTIVGWNIADKTVTGDKIADNSIGWEHAGWVPGVWKDGVHIASPNHPKIACGSSSTPSGGSVRIDLTVYGFTSTPIIICTPVRGDTGFVAQILDTTLSIAGFDVQTRYNNNDVLGPCVFNWMAIGH